MSKAQADCPLLTPVEPKRRQPSSNERQGASRNRRKAVDGVDPRLITVDWQVGTADSMRGCPSPSWACAADPTGPSRRRMHYVLCRFVRRSTAGAWDPLAPDGFVWPCLFFGTWPPNRSASCTANYSGRGTTERVARGSIHREEPIVARCRRRKGNCGYCVTVRRSQPWSVATKR
jgi:hypothetical protein